MPTRIDARSVSSSGPSPEPEANDVPVASAARSSPISQNVVEERDAEVFGAMAESSTGESDLRALARSINPGERLDVTVSGGASADGLNADASARAQVRHLDDGSSEVKLLANQKFGVGDERVKAQLGTVDGSTYRMKSPEGVADLLQAVAQTTVVNQGTRALLGNAAGDTIDRASALFDVKPDATRRLDRYGSNNLAERRLGLTASAEVKVGHGPIEAGVGAVGAMTGVLDLRDVSKPKLRMEGEVALSADARAQLSEVISVGGLSGEVKVSLKALQEIELTPSQAAAIKSGDLSSLASIARQAKVNPTYELEIEGSAGAQAAVGGANASFIARAELSKLQVSNVSTIATAVLSSAEFRGELAYGAGTSQLHSGFDAEVVHAKIDAQKSHVAEFRNLSFSNLRRRVLDSHADEQHVAAQSARYRLH